MLAGVIDPDCQGEIGLLCHDGGKEEDIWNTGDHLEHLWAFWCSSVSKASTCNVGETWVQFLGWEVPLEKEMATHSSILAWRIPYTEEPGSTKSIS